MEARMGRNRVVVAVLLEHSVKVATSRHRIREMAKAGMLFRGARLSPSHRDRPDTYRTQRKPTGGGSAASNTSVRQNRRAVRSLYGS